MTADARGAVPPRIGLTTYFTEAEWGIWRGEAAIVPGQYLAAVSAAGGLPLLLPPMTADPSVLDALDALVLLGGNDVDPGGYGAASHPDTVSDPRRDAQETRLLRTALDLGMPILAICRGIQVLNVALGGTLHQHLPELLGHNDYRPAPAVFGHVSITTEPGSRIAGVLGAAADVRCYHHQAIDQVAPGLRVTARSADGLVQAVEPSRPADAKHSDVDPWVVGVQFHPEESPEDPRLFEALITAARADRSRTDQSMGVRT